MNAHGKLTNTNGSVVRRFHFLMPAILQGLAWPFGRFALDFFTHLTIEGRDNLKEVTRLSKEQGTGVIFAVNHTHELDFSFPLVAVSPFSPLFPMFYVVHSRKNYLKRKKLGFRRHIYGLPIFMKSWGAHPYIENQRNYAKALPYHVRLLQFGKSVCIFPEGKIKGSDSERKIHGGIGYLAETTGAITIPVAVSGVSNMDVPSFLKRKRRLKIVYGAPLLSEEVINPSLELPNRHKSAAKKIMDALDEQIN